MLSRFVVRRLRTLISTERRARLIAKTLPPERWYSAAIALTRFQWAVCRAIWWLPHIALRNTVFIDMVLLELMKYGTFPMRSRVVGAQHLEAPHGAGILFCSSHLPLFAVISRLLTENNAMPTFVIAHPAAIRSDGTYPMPGVEIGVPALPPGARAMVRARRVLQQGGIVASLMDEYPGGPLKPQLLRLAGRLGAKTVFLFSELDANNVVTLTAALPPYPECATEQEVEANLAAYDSERQRILAPFHGSDAAAQPRPC